MTAPALHLETVVTSIATLSVSGLTVCDLNTIPEQIDRGSILFPSAGEPSFVSDFSIEADSYGGATGALASAYYTLNYVFWYMPVGATRGLYEIYPGMVALAVDIIDAFNALDNIGGAVEFTPILGDFIEITDPVGNVGHGCLFSVRVHDFMN